MISILLRLQGRILYYQQAQCLASPGWAKQVGPVVDVTARA